MPVINSGEPLYVIEFSTEHSLLVIVAALMVTVAWSVFSRKGKTLTLIKNVRRHAQQYLDLEYHGHPKAREETYRRLLVEEGALLRLPPKQQSLIVDQQQLLDLLDEAHRVHLEFVERHPAEFPNGNIGEQHPRLDTESFRSPSSPSEV